MLGGRPAAIDYVLYSHTEIPCNTNSIKRCGKGKGVGYFHLLIFFSMCLPSFLQINLWAISIISQNIRKMLVKQVDFSA
jgi:hypothetical protein